MTPDASAMAGFGGPPDVSLVVVAVYALLALAGVVITAAVLAVLSLPIFFVALLLMEGLLNLQKRFAGRRSKSEGFVLIDIAGVPLFYMNGGLAFLYACVVLAVVYACSAVGFVLLVVLEAAKSGYAMATGRLVGTGTEGTLVERIVRHAVGLFVSNPRELFWGLMDVPEYATLVFRSLRRNLFRTALIYVALFVLTFVLCIVYGMVANVGKLTEDKEGSQMVILTEKFGIPSTMPPGYADALKRIIRDKLPKQYQPADVDRNFMTWSFVGATLDATKFSPENNFFLFALDPQAVADGMMSEQGLKAEDLGEDGWQELLVGVELMKQDIRNIIIGEDKLKQLNKRVGDEVKFTSTNYKELVFECRIVGAFPAGSRLGGAAAMQYRYLSAKLDDYLVRQKKPHPLADRCLNLVWVRMPSKEAFEKLAAIVNRPETFSAPAAKMETFSAAIGSFLEPYKDIFWGLKFVIMPAIVGIMCLVIGITITIGVRERRGEMAVLKVLGFQPGQVQAMVVSESVLIGLYGSLLASWTAYFLPVLVSKLSRLSGAKSSFADQLKSPEIILVLGPLLGIAVGVFGALMPSRAASKVKVSEVFAQVA